MMSQRAIRVMQSWNQIKLNLIFVLCPNTCSWFNRVWKLFVIMLSLHVWRLDEFQFKHKMCWHSAAGDKVEPSPQDNECSLDGDAELMMLPDCVTCLHDHSAEAELLEMKRKEALWEQLQPQWEDVASWWDSKLQNNVRTPPTAAC